MKTSAVASGPNASPMSENKAAAADSIRRAQQGEVDAFELLYREHSGRIYALCLRLQAGDRSDAAELMQDVFIRAWRGLATFRGECAFGSWLHRLAVNTMLENARSDRRRTARVEGYQHQEIAEELGVTVGTVKAQLHRARRLLRERLER